ncbi:hypothetical protein AVEN_37721-1 [Araneus ventricosus]|uniref:Uncharacterized protein n=1 Tax=Araneus ventricosus TaxID=182803 RepID=A0A4Y2BST9_ARAVE|nr:hypothetical protein AVEN_37721-1 [Araneus ventricosus]
MAYHVSRVHMNPCRHTGIISIICYEKLSVIPLLFVNLQPPNLTSINPCLLFAADECRKRQQRHIVTFDQPLSIIAMYTVSQADETDALSKKKPGAGVSNRDTIGLSHPLYTRRQTTCCISFVAAAKETVPEIVSASEVAHMHHYAAKVREGPASIGIFEIPKMNAISKAIAIQMIMSKSNVPAP